MKQRYMAVRLAIIAILLVIGMTLAAVPGSAQVSFPEGEAVVSATLVVRQSYIEGGAADVRVHRATAAWDEGTVTWNSFAGEYDGHVEGSFASGLGWHGVDVTSLVQAWLDGTYPNYGFLLEQSAEGQNVYRSSEFVTVAERPMLEVCFEGGTCITIQRGAYGDVADAQIRETHPDTNYDGDDLITGAIAGKQKQTLIWFELPPPPPGEGCTLTPGYWKTHSKYGPAPYDATWAMVLPDGEDTLFFDSGQSYFEVLWTEPSGGNAYYILAHAYIAAELNILNGASAPAEVSDAMSQASALLAAYVDEIPKKTPDRALAIELAELLDAYNNGYIGPGHCE